MSSSTSTSTAAVAPLHLADMSAHPAPAGPALLDDKYELLGSVKVRLSASIGQATLSVAELFALQDGSLVPLDKLVSEPLDILLDGRVIARGRLVAVDDSFGISITQPPQGAPA